MRNYHLLANAMREQASASANSISNARFCTISSYDENSHNVKVLIQPEGTESGWMPLGALGVGNGFGLVVGPNLGDMVIVVFAEGDFESGAIVGRYFNVESQAPPVPSGEIWAVHKSGSSLKLLNNGDIEMVAAGNASYTAAAHQFVGPIVTDSTLHTAGDITDNTTLGNTGTMRGMREVFDIHDHGNVENGDGTTNRPNQQV